MAFIYIRRAAVALSLLVLTTASCTVKDSAAPALTGPSGLALTLNLNAIPDSISQDGGSQSSVKVTAIGPDGRPQSGLPLRVDMMVAGVSQDYGALSARSIVTNSDGVATVIYTAPPSPINGVFGTCNSLPGNCVSIVATATGSNFVTANPQQVQIRLVPTGIILPPAAAPTAAFTMSPTTALANVPVTFDASNTQPGTGATAISSYAWSFGDGTTGTGRSVSHTFTSQQTFNVALTVTNDRGLSGTTTVPTSVGALAAPSLRVVFSPAAPTTGQTIVFNAEQSVAPVGHTITAFSWNFGDGTSGTGSIASHAFSTAGTYNVVLSALDDTGQTTATSVSVSVIAGGASGGGSTAAAFVNSPTAPVTGQVVFFNASGSTAATGHTLTRYAWDFGDGTVFSGTTSSATHTFQNPGTFTVSLTVTDDTNATAKTANAVTVAAAGTVAPTASFISSPSAPGVNQTVFFNASGSSAAPGHTITGYAWDFGDGATGTGVSPTHAYTRAGSYTITMVVTDDASQTKSATGNVTVGSGSAQIVADFVFSPTNPFAADTIFFDSTPSSSPSAITGFAWNFGDGVTCGTAPLAACPGTNAKPTHSYGGVAHTWVARLTITDSAGRTATVTKDVTTR